MDAKQTGHKNTPLFCGNNDKYYLSVPCREDHIPPIFPAIDNDLALENLTNDFDITAADMQDLP